MVSQEMYLTFIVLVGVAEMVHSADVNEVKEVMEPGERLTIQDHLGVMAKHCSMYNHIVTTNIDN